MNFQDKTKEELLAEVLKLQKENLALKRTTEKNPENTPSRAFNPRSDDASNLAALRQKAEYLHKQKQLKPDDNLDQAEAAKLIHELQVHQIELEMQAEEMQRANSAALDAIELYDFAPMAYFTLTQTGEVIRLNLSGAALLGKVRSQLQNCKLADFVSKKSIPTFNQFLNNVFNGITTESCEVVLCANDNVLSDVFITGIITESQKTCLVTAVNISARKQAEVDLLNSQNQYFDLYENAPDMYLSVDASTGRIVRCNSTMLKKTGFEKQEVIGKTVFEMYHPDCMEDAREAFRVFKSTGKVSDKELQVLRKDGSKLFVSLNATSVRNTEGNITESRSSWRDITDRRHAEEMLHQSELRLRSYFDLPLIGIAITSPEKGWIEVNESLKSLLGYSMDELAGLSWAELTHPDDLEADLEQFNLVLADRQDTYFLEKRFICKNGDIVWTYLSAGCVRRPDRSVDYFVAMLQNISERKNAETALIQSEKKFRSLYTYMAEGAALHNLVYNEKGVPEDYLIVEVNPAFEIQLGIARESVINKTSKAAYGVADPPYFDAYTRVTLTGKPEVFETYFAPLDKYFSISVYRPYPGSFATVFENISERKKAEEALRISEDKFKNLVMNMPVGVLLQGPDAEMILSNTKALELLGITEDQLLGRTSFDPSWNVIHEDGSPFPGNTHPVPQAIATRLPMQSVIMGVYRPSTGDRAWLLVDALPQLNDDGTVNHVICTFIDISERKLAETENERTQKLLEDSQSIGKIGGWEFNIDTRELKWTREMYAIHEVDLSFKPGVDYRSGFYTPESLPAIDKAIQRAFEYGESFEVDSEIITAKGNRRSVKSIGKADLKNRRIFGLFQDITERKQAEKKLLETNLYLENLINYANAPIIVWDPQFRITRFNHAFEALTGRTEAEVLGQSLEILFPSVLAGKSMSLIRKTLTGERWETVEIEIQHRDKTSRTVLWNSATLFAPDGKTPLATIAQGQDITRRKKAEEESKRKNLELEKINSEKDKFFSIIAHDLRGPFNGFLGLTQLMSEEISSLTLKELQDISSGLNVSANNLYNLLNNLLEWSRMQQGATSFEPKSVSLHPFATSTLQLMMDSSSKKGIALNIHIPENIYVFADEKMLASTIRNLVSNAVKYTRTGGSVSISANYGPDNHVVITVKDTGIGMDTKILANMFKLDTSISRKGTDGEPSTGLGLLLCKDFIEKHDGKIWAESEVGKGSTFYFTVPVGHSDLS